MRPRDPKTALMDWVDAQVQLDRGTKYILDKAARFADPHGWGWVLVADLAERTNSSERTVQYALRKLEADGLLRRTGETKTLNEGSRFPRRVPIYQFAPGVAGIDPLAGSGAEFAPERGLGCNRTPAGVQTVAPRNELIGTDPSSDDEGARAQEREAVFERLEAAYPKRGLGFTNRPRARAECFRLLDDGIDAEKLIGSATAFAADRAGKKTDQALEYWLADGKYRGWWPEAQLFDEPPKSPGAQAHADAASWEDGQLWAKVEARLASALTETEFGSYIRPAFLGCRSGLLFVVAGTGVARDWIARSCWRRVAAWWAETDPAKRPLTLISKAEFEAGAARQAFRATTDDVHGGIE